MTARGPSMGGPSTDEEATDERGRRLQSATFAPVRVAASGRPPILVGSLIAGLLAVAIVVASNGRDRPSASAEVANAASPDVATEASPVPSYPVVSVPAGSTVPDPFGVNVVTSGRRISVTGTLGVHANLVTVTIETIDGMTADWMLLGVGNPEGEIRLDSAPPFSAEFNLAKAFANVPLLVQVDAYTDTGARVASTIRPAAAYGAPGRPMGSRVH
jgi:hypothetical protein